MSGAFNQEKSFSVPTTGQGDLPTQVVQLCRSMREVSHHIRASRAATRQNEDLLLRIERALDILVGVELNGSSPVDPHRAAAEASSDPAELGPHVFRFNGDLWELRYEGRTAHLRDLKGMRDIARLLAIPGQSIHCLEMASRPYEAGDTQPILDQNARRQYEQRINDLREDLAEAERFGDLGRSQTARTELDALTDEIASAFGLGGRERRLRCPVERARTAVTWRIRSAIKRIERVHAPLASHLRRYIRTGTSASYSPHSSLNGICWEI